MGQGGQQRIIILAKHNWNVRSRNALIAGSAYGPVSKPGRCPTLPQSDLTGIGGGGYLSCRGNCQPMHSLLESGSLHSKKGSCAIGGDASLVDGFGISSSLFPP